MADEGRPISKPSAQSIKIDALADGHQLGHATGFVVQGRRGPLLVTNRHVVTGRDQNTGQPLHKASGFVPDKLIVHHHGPALGGWLPCEEPLYHNQSPRWIEHPTLGAKADFVGLPLSTVYLRSLYPFDPSDPGPPILVQPSDPLSVIGFPFGLSSEGWPIWSTGFLASEPAIDHDGLPVFLIDCRTRQGQSGSAVIAHRNGGMVNMEGGNVAMYSGHVTRFLGIYSGRINENSDLGIVWKAKALAELVQAS